LNRQLMAILVVGAIVLAIGLTPLALVNAQTPSKSYTTTTAYGTRIAYDITMKPSTPMNAPIAVLVHGFAGNRIMMRLIAYALADKGFICASIDLQGHGSSEGAMSVYESGFGTFVNDVMAVIGDLKAMGIGNTSRLVLIGHSMGGGVVLTLGTQLTSVMAVIGIAPESSPAWANTTSPKNLLLMISTGDSVINATTVKQTFYSSIGATGAINTVYDIAGNKRELFVVNGPDHLSIVYNMAVIAEIVNWTTSYVLGVQQSLGISTDLVYASVYVSIAGGVIVITCALALAYGALVHERKHQESSKKTDMKQVLILGGTAILLGGIPGSVIAFMLIILFTFVTDLLITNFLTAMFLGNAIVLAIMTSRKLKRGAKGFSYPRFLRESVIRPTFKIDLVFGIFGAVAFIVLLTVTMGSNTTSTFSIASIRLITLPLYIYFFAWIFVCYESFFKGVVRPLLPDGVKRMTISVIFEIIVLIVTFVIQLIIMTTLLSLVMPSFGIGSLILGLGLQVVLLLSVPLTIGLVSAELFYEKTGGWLPQTIIAAVIFATLTVVFSPVLSFRWTFRF
jgi:dienelactone hydrolase